MGIIILRRLGLVEFLPWLLVVKRCITGLLYKILLVRLTLMTRHYCLNSRIFSVLTARNNAIIYRTQTKIYIELYESISARPRKIYIIRNNYFLKRNSMNHFLMTLCLSSAINWIEMLFNYYEFQVDWHH